MAKPEKADLFHLIKSLTKAEKRQFSLLYDKSNGEELPMYAQLFHVLDSMKSYDSGAVREKLAHLSPTQIANLKRHLFILVLKTLRQLESKKRNDIYISERIDYARILYSKGFYLQSLRILEKLLPLAIQAEEPLLQLEIMEFEKYIEARHITRSRRVKDKMEVLIERSATMSRELSNTVALSNLSLDIHGYYIQHGFVRSKEDKTQVTQYFHNQLLNIPEKNLSFSDEVYLAQSYMWFHYITQNVRGVYRFALRWVQQFESHPHIMERDPSAYLRGLHYLLLACFYMNQTSRYDNIFKKMKKYLKKQDTLPITSQMLAFFYFTNAQLNRYILKGRYKQATVLEADIMKGLETFKIQLDTHRVLILYYKMAWVHFALKQYNDALDYLNLIIHRKTRHLRRELHVFAQLLHLCIHLEQGHYSLSKYLLRSVRRTLKNSSQDSATLQRVLTFLQHWINQPSTVQKEAHRLNRELASLEVESYDWRSLTYFNFVDWTSAIAMSTTIEKATQLRIKTS